MHAQRYVGFRRRSCSTSRCCERNYTSRCPFKAISPVTMSRWLQDAGSPEGSAWDVRSVGLSTEIQTNMDISKVLKAANWTRLTTMQRHYFNVSSRWLGFHTWPVKCTVVIILLLLWADQVFRCYCEQTLFSFATVSKLYCFFEILVSFWKHFLFLRETLQILILLALLSDQLVWVKIKFSKLT